MIDGTCVRHDGLIYDAEDHLKINGCRSWKIDNRGYARGCVDGRNQYLHRFLTGAEKGQVVDHINGNTLDCRRANLRLTDMKGNGRNRKPAYSNKTGYKGVGEISTGCWRAQIRKSGKQIYLGMFSKPEDAARAYDEAAKRLFGEYAWLNFPGTISHRAGGAR